MAADPLKGTTMRWSYSDGPVQGKLFEHTFTDDGKVGWKFAGDAQASADSNVAYQFARINAEVYVFSYLAGSGYTLTTVVDERSGKIVSFASNERELVIQHGSIERKQP